MTSTRLYAGLFTILPVLLLSATATRGLAEQTEPAVQFTVNVIAEVEANADASAACESADACDDAPCDAATDSAANAESPEGAAASDDTAKRVAPTHHQTKIIKVHVDSLADASLTTFCLSHEGDLLAACGSGESGDVRRFSPTGEFITSWELPFAPEAINVGSDGRVYAAGGGRLARFTLAGELVNEGEHPRSEALQTERDKLRDEVIESHKQQVEWMTQELDGLEARVAAVDLWIERADAETAEESEAEAAEEPADATEDVAVDGEPDAEPSDAGEAEVDPMVAMILTQLDSMPEEQRMALAETYRESFSSQLESYQDHLEQQGGAELTEEQIDEKIQASIAYKMKVASISEADGEVFLATGASQGYGFSVWRTNRRFEDGEQIVKSLSGCCGQMDVQASEHGVYVAENSRHKVRCFDRNGERVCDWGSQARSGLEGFGGCCNPMNVAFGPGGDVYTAESETGRIKRFSDSGDFVELVGRAELVPGCKKVSIAVGPEGDRVYMLDITRNHIVMLERLGEGETTDYFENRTASSGGGSWLESFVRMIGD